MRVGVGGEARVEIQRVHAMVRIGEVGEVVDDLVRREPALEDLRARGQRQRIEPRELIGRVGDGLDVQQCLLNEMVEVGRIRARVGCREHPLPDRKLRCRGGRPQHRGVDRNVAHAQVGESAVVHRALDESRGPRCRCGGLREKEVADAESAELEIGSAGHRTKEASGQIHGHAAAVADAERRDATAVGYRTQRLARHIDDVMRRPAVFARDEADAAAALFVAVIPHQVWSPDRVHAGPLVGMWVPDANATRCGVGAVRRCDNGAARRCDIGAARTTIT